MLMGGDDLPCILSPDCNYIANKILRVPWLPDNSPLIDVGSSSADTGASKGREASEASRGAPSFLANVSAFRIPISNFFVKERLVDLKLVELLVDMVFSHPRSMHFNESETNEAAPLLVNSLSEEWCAALACLVNLISGCDAAKLALETSFGTESAISLILPLLTNSANQILLNFLAELCVENGRVISPVRPFGVCCRITPEIFSIPVQLNSYSTAQFSQRYFSSILTAVVSNDCIRPRELQVSKVFRSGKPNSAIALHGVVPAEERLLLSSSKNASRPNNAQLDQSDWETASSTSRLRYNSSNRSFQDFETSENRSSNSRNLLSYFQDQFKRPSLPTIAVSVGDNYSIAEESHCSTDVSPFTPFLSSLEWGLANYMVLSVCALYVL